MMEFSSIVATGLIFIAFALQESQKNEAHESLLQEWLLQLQTKGFVLLPTEGGYTQLLEDLHARIRERHKDSGANLTRLETGNGKGIIAVEDMIQATLEEINQNLHELITSGTSPSRPVSVDNIQASLQNQSERPDLVSLLLETHHRIDINAALKSAILELDTDRQRRFSNSSKQTC